MKLVKFWTYLSQHTSCCLCLSRPPHTCAFGFFLKGFHRVQLVPGMRSRSPRSLDSSPGPKSYFFKSRSRSLETIRWFWIFMYSLLCLHFISDVTPHASIALNSYCHLGSWGLRPLAPDKRRPYSNSVTIEYFKAIFLILVFINKIHKVFSLHTVVLKFC